MLQLRNSLTPCQVLMPIFGNMWNHQEYTDGLIVCRGGVVRFCSFILASHSTLFKNILLEAEENTVLLLDFSFELVEGIVGLLHGCEEEFKTVYHQELKNLIALLGIQLRPNLAKQTNSSRKRKIDEVDDDIIITFDKGKGSPYRPDPSSLRRTYHTRKYKDWSRRDEEGRNQGPANPTFLRVDYQKLPFDEIKEEVDDYPETIPLGPEGEETQALAERAEGSGDQVEEEIVEKSGAAVDPSLPKPEVDSNENSPTKGELFSKENAREMVIKYIKKDDTLYSCTFDQCSFNSLRFEYIEQHVYKHLNIFILQCDVCGFKTRRQYNLDRHMKRHPEYSLRNKTGPRELLPADEESSDLITLDAQVLYESSNEADYEDESLTWDDLGAATTGQILPDLETPESQDVLGLEDDQEESQDKETSNHGQIHEQLPGKSLEEGEVEPENEYNSSAALEQISLDRSQYRVNQEGLIVLKANDALNLARPHYAGQDGFYACLLCKKFNKKRRFASKDIVVSHILKHLNVFSHECKYCNKAFRSRTELTDHIGACNPELAAATGQVVEFSPSSRRKLVHAYHLNKTTIFMPENKAHRIISSYIVFVSKAVGGIEYQCSLCPEKSGNERDVFEHVALVHLNILQFKCFKCGIKFKIRRLYDEHLKEEHETTMEGEELTFKMEVEEEETGQGDTENKQSMLIYQDELGTTVLLNSEPEVQAEAEPAPKFNYEENGFRLQISPGGTKLVYVVGAAEPLLKSVKDHLLKICRARVLDKEEANQAVAGSFFRNSRTKKYECTKCDGQFQSESMVVMQRHLYEHFDIYLYTCPHCRDVFRNTSKLSDHVELHARRAELKTRESKLINQSQMIGDYATAEADVFIPPDQAKPIVESYISLDTSVPGYNWFKCKLCLFARDNYNVTYNHTIRNHLKINQFECDKCEKPFKLEEDLKRHYVAAHDRIYPSTLQDDDELKDDETDIPDVTDLGVLSMSDLKGKKVSSDQARTLRGKFLVRNEVSQRFECELCEFKSDWKTTVQAHVYTKHYDIYMFRCKQCDQLMRNWNQFTVHQRSHKKIFSKNKTCTKLTSEHHLRTEPLYLGEKEGKAAAEQYVYYDIKHKMQRCKMCDYSSRKTQLVAMHVLAKHLPFIYLYRCDECAKEFRYSRNQFNEHKLLHSEGRQPCTTCVQLGVGGEGEEGEGATYSRESFKSHLKRFHTPGHFQCKIADCGVVEGTKMELTKHEASEHLIGVKEKVFKCHICEYEFPTKTRLKKHVLLCEVGRTRTLFRKQISDVLQWMGRGSYRCTFCQQEFHPLPGDVTMTGLPEARNHVVSVHGMRHMKRLKMQWLGEPASVDKSNKYKDKSAIWNQKVKDIEKVRNQVIQESHAQSIQQEVSNNIARAATSYKTMLEALAQTSNNQDQDAKSILLQVIGQNSDLETKTVVGWEEQEKEEPKEVEGQVWEEGGERIFLGVVEEDGQYREQEMFFQQDTKEILVETEDMKVFVQSEGSTQRTEVFPEGTHQRTEVFPESSHQRTEVFPEIEQKIFLEQPSTPTILIHDKDIVVRNSEDVVHRVGQTNKLQHREVGQFDQLDDVVHQHQVDLVQQVGHQAHATQHVRVFRPSGQFVRPQGLNVQHGRIIRQPGQVVYRPEQISVLGLDSGRTRSPDTVEVYLQTTQDEP